MAFTDFATALLPEHSDVILEVTVSLLMYAIPRARCHPSDSDSSLVYSEKADLPSDERPSSDTLVAAGH